MHERVRAERAREGNVRGKRSAGSRAGGATVRACPEGTKPERGRFERGFARLRRRLSASLCGSRSRGRTVSAVPTASRADDDGTHRVQRDERRRLRRGLQAEVDLHVRAARGVLRGAHRGTRVAAAGTTTARARDTGKKETGRESTETSFCLECRFVADVSSSFWVATKCLSPQRLKKTTTSRFACDERTRRGAPRREATKGATAGYGKEAMPARQGKVQLCGLQPLPAW